MQAREFIKELDTQARSGQSIMYVNTREEGRVVSAIREAGWRIVREGHASLSSAECTRVVEALESAGVDASLFKKDQYVCTSSFANAYRIIESRAAFTDEEERIRDRQLTALVDVMDAIGYRTVCWDVVSGFDIDGGLPQSDELHSAIQDVIGNPDSKLPKQCFIVMKDCHKLLGSEEVTAYRRALRNVSEDDRLMHGEMRRHIIFVQPYMRPHADIRHCMTRLDFSLPDDAEIDRAISRAQNNMVEKSKAYCSPELRAELIGSLRGLDTANIDKTLAYCIVDFGGFTPEIERDGVKRRMVTAVRSLRSRQLSAGQGIRIVNPEDPEIADLGDISGWENVRELADEVIFGRSPLAVENEIESPNGFAVAGFPGCGKTHCAKLFSKWLGVPLVILSVATAKGGVVGESESNMANAIDTINAMGDCVVLLDEMDKHLGGNLTGGGANDGNTSLGMLSILLDFAADPARKAFLVFTLNRIVGVPIESVRAGRVSRFMYVPMPTAEDRAAILQLKLSERNATVSAGTITAIASEECTGGLSGAELNEMVKKAVLTAVRRTGKKDVTLEDLEQARAVVTPVAKLSKDDVDAMLNFDKQGAIPVSNRAKAAAVKSGLPLRRGIRLEPGSN